MAKSNSIIIKKVKKGGHGAHGGAWKVAYADFVTAMMAFFLLLWLLNATTNAQKRGIADYFAPTLATNSTVSGADGVMGGKTMSSPGAEASDSSPSSLSDSLPHIPTNPDSDDDDTYGPGQSQGASNQTGNDDSSHGVTVNTQGTAEEGGQGSGNGPGTGGAVDINGKDKRSAGLVDPKGIDLGKVPAALIQKIKEAQQQEQQKKEDQQLQQAQQQLQQAIQSSPELQGLDKNITVERTEDGLRIQIIDQQQTAMFTSGSTQLSEPARKLLAQVTKAIAKLPNEVMITGHTDSTPYLANADYSNWELSADRANAARRALIGDGLPASRIATVVGKADTDNFIKDNPADPRNRRISIIVLRALRQNSTVQITNPVDQPAAPSPAPVATTTAAINTAGTGVAIEGLGNATSAPARP